MKTRIITAIATALIFSATVTGCATGRNAKVSQADAERTALAKVPGGIVKEAELEKEHGRLVWSFDIATPGSTTITEIHVDAKTEEIVATEHEVEESERKEKAAKK